MKCPNDQTTLVISERQNIEIDYCPECRGVWLDRGELDKLIERSQQMFAPSQPQTASSATSSQTTYNDQNQPENGRYSSHHDADNRYYKKKKKESFLGDLFEF